MNKRTINVLVCGHSQHGKSSLIEAIVGKFPDILDFELSHGTTVSLKVIQFPIKDKDILINFLDSPGHADFKGSIALGLEFTDLLLLVISGSEGFQARTYWLYEQAMEKEIPILIASTKMDLPNAKTEMINEELNRLGTKKFPIVETSAKELFGIEELIKQLSVYVEKREKINSNIEFIILGFRDRKGLGEVINIGIQSGTIQTGGWLSEKLKIRQLFSLKGKPLKLAEQGQIVQVSLNQDIEVELGTKYKRGKFISPKIASTLSEIQPRKEFHITIDDPKKFEIAMEVLDNLKKIIPSFDFYTEKSNINILVVGDLQFEYIKENLENLIDFKIIESRVKGIITIDKISTAHFKSARVRIVPRFKNKLTVSRINSEDSNLYDFLGSSAAREAFHLDGLHVDIYDGKNEDHISQAIAKAIEKVNIIKIIPHQDIIVKIENYHDIYPLIDKYDIEVLYQSQTNIFFLQVKNHEFEAFFNSLMKISNGQAEMKLFKFDQREKILAVDPGTRHFGFSKLTGNAGEIPSLWYVNLKDHLENIRSHNVAKEHLSRELDIFLESDKELINKIFIGNGPGSEFIIEFLIEYFNIPCENGECIVSNFEKTSEHPITQPLYNSKFDPPEIFLVDEFKTSKEALYHLKQGKLVSEVKTKGFVDHAIAALLIAKRGIKGEVINLDKKPMKLLKDYVTETYSGTYSFSSLHKVRGIEDLEQGMFLRVKDSSKLDSSLEKGEIIKFLGFGRGYNNLHATTITGNKIIVKFDASVRVKKEFFDIFVPMKEK
ncbi:MAG: hypothetical protein BAJALOKI2v1_480002 [Promethearchaeota archaeon]|nr:MAG: hypothetical protein BAJALOKI2v1_480002 [Candidatus Lokiarchaeota archaeon]